MATTAFPNIPVFLWGDKTPAGVPGSKYHSSYFARFDHVWAHGDFIVVHPITKNITFLGRADGVLNPSGVRFGSAEVYSVLERHFVDQIVDSICVGQRRPKDNDESVMLFLLMRPGHTFNQKLVRDVKDAIKKDLSKRHVPKYVFETPEIPVSVYVVAPNLRCNKSLTLLIDNYKLEEGRAPCQTDRFGTDNQAKWNSA